MSTDPKESQPVGAVKRATAILQLFIDTPQASLGVTEIANELGLSKAVVHRALTSLREPELVSVDQESRRYMLGPTALALGVAYLSRQDIRERARPFLRTLSAQTNETATLSIRRADVRVYLDQVTPAREVKMTVAIGESYPLHAGSSSKAFLAFLSPQEQEVYLRDHRLQAMTEITITAVDDLRLELQRIRELGYAQSLGERQPGSASIAAPVFNFEGDPIGVISICGPVERFKGHMQEASALLISQTRELSRLMGAPREITGHTST